jgi:phosphate transport system ATP-binding protein
METMSIQSHSPLGHAEQAAPALPATEHQELATDAGAQLSVTELRAGFGSAEILKNLNMEIAPRATTAIIGPSGCGKSTFIRCLNRMHEVTPGAFVSGQVHLNGVNVYDSRVDPVRVRRRIGMVFQKPNPFPSMSVRDNVLAGLTLNRVKVSNAEEVVESSLRRVALWDEVKDKLKQPGTSLSGGQQQRLCIARSIALRPDVLLMDEPCSALDPIATARIEELITELRQQYTIVIVTHNMQQAARIAQKTAFFFMGVLIEYDQTDVIFTRPAQKQTEDYVTGRFG